VSNFKFAHCSRFSRFSLFPSEFLIGYHVPHMSPEEERSSLTDLYASMTPGQLWMLALEPESLTEMAQEVMRAELARRRIRLPKSWADLQNPRNPEPDTRAGEPPPIVLCRFRDLPEAMLAKGKLDSAGIECHLADDNTVRMDWLWSNAIGGVKLLVREKDAREAARLLDQPILERLYVPGVGEYDQPACPSCRSLDVSFDELNRGLSYGSVFIGVPVPVHRRGWTCHDCGHTWEKRG
jgi:Putative prokaryotic signal transducing protein